MTACDLRKARGRWTGAILAACIGGIGLALSGTTAPADARPAFSCVPLESTSDTANPMTQGLNGWFFRTNSDLEEDFYLAEETKDLFTRLVEAGQQRGITLVFVPVPPRGLLAANHLRRDAARQLRYDPAETSDTFHGFVKELRSTGLVVPDVLQAANRRTADAGPGFFFKRDFHWTPAGAQATARAVAEELRKLPLFGQLQTAEFSTQARSEQSLKYIMAMDIQRHCEDFLPPETFTEYETSMREPVASSSAGDNADLFGAPAGADELVLLGTSFSDLAQFNFDGALSEHTGLAVANYSISAGGAYNAMLSYLSAPGFEEAAPALIVWEAPSYLAFNKLSPTALRQAIPAMYGDCTGTRAVASSRVKLSPGDEKPLLIDLPSAATQVSGSGYYLRLRTRNLAFARFTLRIEYEDDDFEWFTFDRTEHFDNRGQFFVEFSDDVSSAVTRVVLTRAPQTPLDLQVDVCRSPVLDSRTSSSRYAPRTIPALSLEKHS